MNIWRFVSMMVFVILLAGVAVVPQRAVAQGAVTSASLFGDVVDKTGAALPGAKVTVTAKATGLKHEATADQNGHFSVLQLPPGAYAVRVEMKNFSSKVIDPLELMIADVRTIKVALDVGEVAQTVQVSAEAISVDTTSTDVGNVINTSQLAELPLNQRSFTALVVQQPSLVQITSTVKPSVLGAATNTGSYISADGSMGASVAYLMDGVNFSNGSFTAPGTASAGDTPGVEAIQEFKVLSHNYSAEYGGASAAIVSFATKSGTNNFHGSVYEYFRNDALDARSFFDDPTLAKPPFHRNQFGGTFGGPLIKNRTFFFVNYEGLRQSLTSTEQAFVPSDCSRSGGVAAPGDTQYCPDSTLVGSPPTIGGVPVPFSPAVAQILNLYPDPHGVGAIDLKNGIVQVPFLNSQLTRQDFGLVNINHSFNASNTLQVRYQIVDADASQTPNVPVFEFLRADRMQNLMLKWVHTFNPNLIQTLSFSVLRQLVDSSTQPLGPAVGVFTGNSTRGTMGVITVGNGSAGTAGGALSLMGNDDASPFQMAKNTFPINSDWLWVKGKHTLKFGGMVQRFQWNWQSAVIPGGSYTFGSLNDLMAANPSVALIRRDDAQPNLHVRTTAIAWYMQDSWRISPRLTLNMGLRHDFRVPILTSSDGRLGNWPSPTATATTQGGEPYNNYSLTQFQPRIGVAWDPWGNGKTVIRAGFGLFNDFVDFAGDAQGILQWNSPNPVLNTYFGQPFGGPQIPFPTCDATPFCTAASPYIGLVTGVLDPADSPTTSQWSLEIQRELPAKILFTIGYAGSQSYHIGRKLEQNYNIPCGGLANPTLDSNGLPVFPYYGVNCAPLGTGAPGVSGIAFSLYSRKYDTNANYHGVTVQVARSFGNLTFQAAYRFSKAISESDAFNSQNMISGVAQSSVYPPDPRYDRSESAFSVRHRFTENFVYNLPFGKGQKYVNDDGVANAILGGWTVGSLGTFQSGQPFTVFTGFDVTGMGDAIDFPQRPDVVNPNAILGSPFGYFNPAAFSLPALGHMGTASRTPLRGPGFSDLDLNLGKKFMLSERVNLAFRADVFNLLNHPNFALPFSTLYIPAPTGVPGTGAVCGLTPAQEATTSCNPQAGKITNIVGVPRQVQLSLKLTF